MSYQDSCLFCQIAQKKIDAEIVAENDRVLAFMDINPQAKIHALIIPKFHFANLIDLEPEHALFLSDIGLMADQLAKKFDVAKDGFRVVINSGAQAYQTVFHLHAHFLAGRDFSWPPG